MKIWGELPKVLGIDNKSKSVNKVGRTAEVTGKKDVLSISNQAKDFQTVMKAIKDVPDIRMEKVKELSDKYESGNYNVDGKDIAEKILKSARND